jgi:hypothetical protein
MILTVESIEFSGYKLKRYIGFHGRGYIKKEKVRIGWRARRSALAVDRQYYLPIYMKLHV